ncbi:ATP-dependent DNA helicase PIF1-like protein [Tanacetum coccineum]
MATFVAGYINNLSAVKDNITLRVRILRTWMQQVYEKQHNKNLELIVMDEHKLESKREARLDAARKRREEHWKELEAIRKLEEEYEEDPELEEEDEDNEYESFDYDDLHLAYSVRKHLSQYNDVIAYYFRVPIVEVSEDWSLRKIKNDNLLPLFLEDIQTGYALDLYSVHSRDVYYCRMLLNSAKGCRTHDEIKNVNGVVYPTYKEACYTSGLLEDDKEYVDSIKDTAHWASAEHLHLIISDDEKRNVCLFYIKELLRSRGCSLRNFPEMPYQDNRYITKYEHKGVYDTIMNSVETGTGGVYFLYGYEGTDKTFLWKTLVASIRRRGDIVLNVAFSGIASLLMPGGRTAHSRFHIPINIDETSTYSISVQSDLGALLKNAGFLGYSKRLTSRHCKCVSKAILLVRSLQDGELGEENDGEVYIDVPEEILIDEADGPISSIVDLTYPNILDNINDPSYFKEKVVLASMNKVVDNINEHLLDKFPGEEMVYLSCDSVDKTEHNAAIDQSIFSPEFINGLKFFGVPNNRLVLKVGVPIMLLRNIDQPNGLCNGTRLQVLKLTRISISTQIINGTNFGKKVIIPRLRITPSDKRLPLKIVRKQFPLSVSFAMTINKSQGQSLSKVGLYLPCPVFIHGQLYVLRVTSKKGLKVVVCDKGGNIYKTTTNVVYKEVLHGL